MKEQIVCGRSALFLLLICSLCTPVIQAQVSPDLEQGMKPFGSYHGGDLDRVSMSNGNLFFHADLFSYSQRGGELAYPIVLQYNAENFQTYQPNCPPPQRTCPIYVVFGPPWDKTSASFGNSVYLGFEGNATVIETSPSVGVNTSLSLNGNPIFVKLYSVLTSDGSLHPLANTNAGKTVLNGSGYASNGNLVDRHGTKFTSGNIIEDANGNQINLSTGMDTLGRNISAPSLPLPSPPGSAVSVSSCPVLTYPLQPLTAAYNWNVPTVNGDNLTLLVCYASVYVRTNFFGSNPAPSEHDVSGSFQMLQSVVFPDGTYWAFQYDAADPNNTNSIALGDLLKVTLPTGGNISYTWSTRTGSAPLNRAVVTRSVDANDGNGPKTFHYTYSPLTTVNGNPTQYTTIQDPLGNQTVHTMTGLGTFLSLYETQVQYYQGSQSGGTLLKTVNTDYQFTANVWDAAYVGSGGAAQSSNSITNVFPNRVTTTLPNGLVSKVESDYDSGVTYHGPLDGITWNELSCDSQNNCQYTAPTTNPATSYIGSYGKVIATREYDWSQGAPGPLLRQTSTSYLWQSNSTYLTDNFLDLVSSSTTRDAAGNQVALTTYGYDEYSLNPSGASTQFDTTPVNGLFRGNQTSAHHWLNGNTVSTPNCPISISNGFLVNYTQYNDTGTVNEATDPCGTSAGDPNHTATYSYSSTFAYAYPTSATNPLGQTSSTNYDFNSGLVVSITDINNQTTTTGYDVRLRPVQLSSPDGGQATFCYTDSGGATCNQSSAPFKVVVTRKIDSTRSETSTAIVDGLGRKTETQLNSDPACASPGSLADTTYDALGRVATVTNPFCSTSDTTYGLTTTTHDALGRVTQLTHPDGTSASTLYTGRAVEVSDEGNGTRSVQRISQSDALGRLASVCEVSGTTLPFGNSAAPAACNLDIAATGFLTSYGFDTLGNLTGVSQGGYMPRSFLYDSLSRLTQANNPESGTITYTYDAAGDVITRTDARNIITTYAYDKLHRLLSKSFSDGTPTASFVYDTCPPGGCPTGVSPQLTEGRMVESFVSNAKTFYSYDPVGRVLNQWQCTPANCGSSYFALSYGYDLAGDPTSFNNGVGVLLSTGYDTATRVTGVTSNLSDANHPANLLSNIQYNGLGLPRLETLGNNVTETLGYDTRARLSSLNATSPTATPATPGRGTITVNGSEGSQFVAASTAQATVIVNGFEHKYQVCTRNLGCIWVYDIGKVYITINGHEYDYNFSQGDTALTVAQGLATAIQNDGARVVNASCPGGSSAITLTALLDGNGGNWAFTTGYTYASSDPRFASMGPSFTASPASGNLSGGQDAHTVYDSGTVSISINGGTSVQASYANGSTGASIASALASGINNQGLVSAVPNGNSISLSSLLPGGNTNYSLSPGNSSSAGFSPPSFSVGVPSGSALSGGSGASPGTAYSVSVGYAPNSNVLSGNDSVNGNWTYTYDDFNRLIASNKNSGQQTYNYVYDRFGNRWQQNAPQGGSVFIGTFSAGNNRLDGVSHDAAGNVTHDLTTGANYTYDAENRVSQVNGGGVTYIYDADGQRVEKNVGGVITDYIYDAAGHAVVELSGAGAVNRQELFAAGRHLGTYVNNTTYFSHADWLGTERARSDLSGAACETIQSLPFGDGQSTSGGCGDPSTRHFTGKERDSETGLDYFGARYYSNGLGRFITPDWADKPAAIPYAVLGDPQSLNLYSYVRNLPLSGIDLDGHVGSDAVSPSQLKPGECNSEGCRKPDWVVMRDRVNAITNSQQGNNYDDQSKTARFARWTDKANKWLDSKLGRWYKALENVLDLGNQRINDCPEDADCKIAIMPIGPGMLNYRQIFFEAYPELEGQVVVHHSIEQQVLKRFPGRFTAEEINSLPYLRAIRKDANAMTHLSLLRREWNAFYRVNPNASREQLLQKAAELDVKYGLKTR